MALIRIKPTSDISKDGNDTWRVTGGNIFYTDLWSGLDNDNTSHATPTNEYLAQYDYNVNGYMEYVAGMADPTDNGETILRIQLEYMGTGGGPWTEYLYVSIDGTNWDYVGVCYWGNTVSGTVTVDLDFLHLWSFSQLASLQVKMRAVGNSVSWMDRMSVIITTGVLKTISLTDGVDSLAITEDTPYGIASLDVKSAGVGIVNCNGILTAPAKLSGPITFKTAQVASDSGFTTILATTGDITGTGSEDNGDIIALLLSWLPSTAGTYYARIGTKTAAFTSYVYSSMSINVGFPSNIVLTSNIVRNRITLTLTVSDTYSKPPNLTFQIDNAMLSPATMSRTGSGPYTYTFTATAEVETGEHRIAAVLGNVWTTILVDSQMVSVPFVHYTPYFDVFQGERQIDAENVKITERFLPDLSEASFTVPPYTSISGDVTIKQYGGGMKVHQMTVTEQSDRSVRAVSSFQRFSKMTKNVKILTITIKNLLASLASPWILCGRTDLLVGQLDLLDVEDAIGTILADTAIQSGVQLFERSGRIHIVPLAPASGGEAMVVRGGDIDVVKSKRYDTIINKIRQYYAIEEYPVPECAMTNHNSAQWTGTVVNVAQTNNGLIPPSGSIECEKITGLATIPINFSLDDYSSIKFNFAPEALSQTLQLRLYSSVTDYWTLSRTFQGKTGVGQTLLGSSTDDVVTWTITINNRFANLRIVTSADCQVKITLKKGGVSKFESAYASCSIQGATIGIPETVYKSSTDAPFDQLLVTCTKLYAVGASFGVVISSITGSDYVSYAVSTPTGVITTFTDNNTYTLANAGPFTFSVESPSTNFTMTHPASSIRSIPSGATVSSERFYIHCLGLKDGVQIYSGDFGLFAGGYANSFIKDGMLWVDVSSGTIVWSFPAGTIAYFSLKADIAVATQVPEVTVATVWSYTGWSYGTTFCLWDAGELSFSSKVIGAGSPSSQIIKIGTTLVSAGTFYLDTLFVSAKERKWLSLEVQDDTSIAQYGERFSERKLDSVFTEASARVLATGLLAISKDPELTYAKQMPVDANVELGMPVLTDEGTLVVIAMTTSAQGITVQVGSPQQSLRETIASLARRQDALQRIL